MYTTMKPVAIHVYDNENPTPGHSLSLSLPPSPTSTFLVSHIATVVSNAPSPVDHKCLPYVTLY